MQIISYFISSVVLLPLYSFFTITVPQEKLGKISVNPIGVIRESGEGDVGHLVDEPLISSTPDPSHWKDAMTEWEPGYKTIQMPFAAIIDLGTYYNLSQIAFYDGQGQGNVNFYSGQVGNWKLELTNDLGSYNKWRVFEFNTKTRYVRLVLNKSVAPKELVFYGTPISSNPQNGQQRKVNTTKRPEYNSFIGINAFINDPVDKMLATGIVREYHDWMWNGEYLPFNENKIVPTPLGNNYFQTNPSFPGWNFDAFYLKLKNAGLPVLVCLQNSISWLTNKQTDKPIMEGDSSESPFSYKEHASFMFQYVARYGSQQVGMDRLHLAPGQPQISGLDLIKYYENWNEPDRWWDGRKGYFRPFEYAAMCSADYDGHLGALGNEAGIKNADNQAQMAMAGLTQLDTNYIKAMKHWSDINRNGSFPADILNFHYCPENPGGTALCPEMDQMKEKFTSLVSYCNRDLPNKKIWVTEFGYDTNEGSPRKCAEIYPYTREEVQAQWLVRATLEAAATGIQQFMIYMLRDVKENGSQQFQTCGLTSTEPTKHLPKPSWYFISCTKGILTNSRFHKDMSVLGIRIYSFVENKTGLQTLAVWSPTANNSVIKDFKLKFSFKVKSLSVNSLQYKSNLPKENKVNFADGQEYFQLTVSETPVFIKLYK